MDNIIYINVAETIGSPSALTQEQGNAVFNKIDQAIADNKIVQLDFLQVESMISPFLNNAFGQLYGKYSSEEISDHLQIQNFPEEKKSTLNIVIANAKRYYKDKDSYNTVIEGVINS